MKYRILLIFALLSLGLRLAAEIAIPFDRSWKLPPSGTISESTLTISATDPAVPQLASHPIDPEPYFGRSLIVRFEVKYSDVSKPKESYNGVKLMIHYFANGKQYWTNCSQLYGSSDWKTVTVEQQIPGDTEWISLETGLQEAPANCKSAMSNWWIGTRKNFIAHRFRYRKISAVNIPNGFYPCRNCVE